MEEKAKDEKEEEEEEVVLTKENTKGEPVVREKEEVENDQEGEVQGRNSPIVA
jgi:hypothetical protein